MSSADPTYRVVVSDLLRAIRRAELQGTVGAGLAAATVEAGPDAGLLAADPGAAALAGRPGPANPEADPVADPALPAPVARPPVARPEFPEVRLRRDGHRPLRFRGLPLVCLAGPSGPADRPDAAGGGAEQRIDLYLTEDRRVAAACIVDLPDCGTARPVYRAEIVDDPDALARFLGRHDPLGGVLDPRTGSPDLADRAALRARLSRDFDRLTAFLGAAARPSTSNVIQ